MEHTVGSGSYCRLYSTCWGRLALARMLKCYTTSYLWRGFYEVFKCHGVLFDEKQHNSPKICFKLNDIMYFTYWVELTK